jgi:hypothetical protein
MIAFPRPSLPNSFGLDRFSRRRDYARRVRSFENRGGIRRENSGMLFRDCVSPRIPGAISPHHPRTSSLVSPHFPAPATGPE